MQHGNIWAICMLCCLKRNITVGPGCLWTGSWNPPHAVIHRLFLYQKLSKLCGGLEDAHVCGDDLLCFALLSRRSFEKLISHSRAFQDLTPWLINCMRNWFWVFEISHCWLGLVQQLPHLSIHNICGCHHVVLFGLTSAITQHEKSVELLLPPLVRTKKVRDIFF